MLFFSFGIIFSQITNFFDFILGATMVISALIFVWTKHKLKITFTFFIIFVLGLVHTKHSEAKLNIIPKLANKNIELEAVIKNVSETKNYYRTLLRAVIKNFDNKSKFYIQAYIKKDNKISPGDKIVLSGKLIFPDDQRNPGGFNEKKYFKSRFISAKIFAHKVTNLGHKNHFTYYLYRIKTKFVDVYDNIFEPRDAGVLKSMLLGDKSAICDYTSNLYKSSGIYHILAISGLHVSIIYGSMSFVLGYIFNKKISNCICIGFLVFYCMMTGTNISTLRAVIMSSLIVASNFLHRDNDLLTSLSLSGLLIMFSNPFCIFDIGFEYSFGAVFGISIFTQAIDHCLSLVGLRFKTPKLLSTSYCTNMLIGIKKYLSASIAASLIGYAITAYYFFYITPYSIFINLLILPNIAFLIILGFIIGGLGLFSPGAANFFRIPAYMLLRFYEGICTFFVKLPFAKVLTGHVNICFLVLYFIWLGFFMHMLSSIENNFFRAKKYFSWFSLWFALIIFVAKMIMTVSPYEVVMLDVGQGDCFVIDCGQTFIIDGGGVPTQDLNNNTGVNVLIPFLDYKAKDYIDAVFVSHPDADHVMGIIELLEHKDIGKLFLAKKNVDSELLKKLLETAREFSTPVEYLEAGDVLANEKLSFSCLYPFSNQSPHKDNNNNSLVLKLKLYNTAILFTGDIEKEAEKEILNSIRHDDNRGYIDQGFKSLENISADILKLAHHGSKTSSTSEFLKKVNPSLAIVSTGKNNVYSHPSKEVIDRLKNLGIPVLNTAESGAVTIKILNSELKIKTQIANA